MAPTTSLIGLSAATAADPALVGTKFSRLAAIHRHVTVPAAWCLPATWFAAALGPVRRAALRISVS